MATLYCIILENLLTKISLTKDAMMSIPEQKGKRYAEKLIKQLEDNNHVRAYDVSRTERGRTKTTNHYFITPAGVRYLRAMAIKDESIEYESKKNTSLPWLKYIDEEDTKGMAVLGELQEERNRVFVVGEAAMFSELAGAVIPFFVQAADNPISDVSTQAMTIEDIVKSQTEMDEYQYDPDELSNRKAKREHRRKQRNQVYAKDENGYVLDENGNRKKIFKKSTKEIMEDAVMRWMAAEHPEMDEDEIESIISYRMNYDNGEIKSYYDSERPDYIRYVHPSSLKYLALLNYSSTDPILNKHDTDRGRYSGVLQSKIRTVLLYPSHNPNLAWTRKMVLLEFEADRKWKNKLKPEYKTSSIEESLCAAVLVQSAARFKNIWKDANRSAKERDEASKRFAHLFIEELHGFGARNLNDIMLSRTADYKERETQNALEPDFGKSMGFTFERNTGRYSEAFPLIGKRGGQDYYFAIGKWMDICQMWEVRKINDTDPVNLGIICEPWQLEYYRIMLPEAVIYWNGREEHEVEEETLTSAAAENYGMKLTGEFEENTEPETCIYFPVTMTIDRKKYYFVPGKLISEAKTEKINDLLRKGKKVGILCEKGQSRYYSLNAHGAEIFWRGKTGTEENRDYVDIAISPDFGASAGIRFRRLAGAKYGDLRNVFPLITEIGGNEYLFAVGKWIDKTNNREIKKQLKEAPDDLDFGYGIICNPDQHRYYKTVFPDAVTFWMGKTMEEIQSDSYGEAEQDEDDLEPRRIKETEYVSEDEGN